MWRSKVKLKAPREAWPWHRCRPVTGQDVPARGRAVTDQKTEKKRKENHTTPWAQRNSRFNIVSLEGKEGLEATLHTTGWKPGMNTLTVLILENIQGKKINTRYCWGLSLDGRRTDGIESSDGRTREFRNGADFCLKQEMFMFSTHICQSKKKKSGCPSKQI